MLENISMAKTFRAILFRPPIIVGFSILLVMMAAFTNCSRGSSDTLPPSTVSIVKAPDFNLFNPNCFIASPLNPVLTRDSGFPGSDWNDPSVLKLGNQYIMYASSDHFFDGKISIYRLTSSDGLSWTLNPSTPVFSPDPNPSAWDHKSVETPSVIYFKGMYHLFYTGYPADHNDVLSFKIGHAVSADGIAWIRDQTYLLAPTDPLNSVPSLAFNQYVVAEPGAVVYQDKIYLYFSALGAHAHVGTVVHTIGLAYSADGVSWSTPQMVLFPDQNLYPHPLWKGFSTPSATVFDSKVHLFFDVIQTSPWKQLRIHHSASPDGISNWKTDLQPVFSHSDFPWTSEEIRSPNVLLDGTSLLIWFAGHNNYPTLGIGQAKCPL